MTRWYHVVPEFGNRNREERVGWVVLRDGRMTATETYDSKTKAVADAKRRARDQGSPGVSIHNPDGSHQKMWDNPDSDHDHKPKEDNYTGYADGPLQSDGY